MWSEGHGLGALVPQWPSPVRNTVSCMLACPHACNLLRFSYLQKDRVITDAAEHYIAMAEMLKAEQLPHGTQWREVEAYREKLVATQEYQWVNFREQKYLMRVSNCGGCVGQGGWTRHAAPQ